MHVVVWLIIVGLAIFFMLVVAEPNRRGAGSKRGDPVRYGLRSLMTAREREFIGLLRRALPDVEIHAQVAMGALIEVIAGGKSARNRFDRKILDYVVCSPAGTVLYAIELDDRSHLSDNAKKRDAVKNEICAAAGLRLVRYSSVRVDVLILRADFERAMVLRSRAIEGIRPNGEPRASGGI